MDNSWGGTIVDPTSDDDQMELEDENPISKQIYKNQYDRFKANVFIEYKDSIWKKSSVLLYYIDFRTRLNQFECSKNMKTVYMR